MHSANTRSSQRMKKDWVIAAEQTVRSFLANHLGADPKSTTVVLADNTILVRAFRPFPEAEAVVLSNHVNDDLYHRYYDRLLAASYETLKRNLAGSLHREIAQIHHVLNPDAQELDVIITMNTSRSNTTLSSEEKAQ